MQSQVRDVVATYGVADFALKRKAIENNVFDHIREDLYPYHINMTSFYILNFDFPSDYMAAVTNTEYVNQ